MKVVDRGRNVGFRLLLVASLIAVMFGSTDALLAKSKKRHAAKASPASAMAIQKPPFVEPREGQPEPGYDPSEHIETPAVALSAQALDPTAPVKAVLSPPLSEIPPIPWYLAPAHSEIEPPLPPEPTDFPKDREPDVIQNFQGPVSSAPTATGVSWDGVGVGLAGFSPTSNPPDTEGRVGATQYVQWNNTSFAVFDKTNGNLLYGPAAGNTLFQALGGLCASHNDGDPLVSYDILAGRWVISQFVVTGGAGSNAHQCIAVSVTGDATGAYYLYDFVTDTTNSIDYPKIGVWPDAYYMSAHIFNAALTSRTGARVYAFERAQMLQGLTARMQQVNLPTVGGGIPFGFLPADLDSLTPPPTGAPEFVVGPHPVTANTTVYWRVTVTWGGTPSIALSATTTLAVGLGTQAPCVNNTNGTGRDCVPQPSPALGTDDLDRLTTRYLYRLAYRNFGGSPVQESMVTTGTVQGSPTGHGAIRWFEFRNAGGSGTTLTSFQAATFDPDTAYRWLGSAAMDSNHDIALGYSKSSTSILPGMYITGRLGTDTVNTMGAEATVQVGQGVQMVVGANNPGNRWGDYADMTLDPVDQCTFYYTNEYLKTNGAFNWSTRVASYKFPACTPAAAWGTVAGQITSCATGAPISGVVVNLSNGFAAASDASGNYSILVPAGSYTATATNTARNCASSTPSSASVSPVSGSTTTQNFCMNGASNLQANGLTFDDSTGNANNVINSNECVGITLNVKNAGCATEMAISGTLTTTTPGVTITQPTATYPNLLIDQSSNSNSQFRIQTSNSFVCGTTIAFALNLTYAGGSKTVNYSVHTCEGGPSQSIPSSQVLTTNSSQPDRLGRVGTASPCAGRACPGPINTAGTRNYKTFTFFNNSGSAECFTATINAALGGGGDIEVAAYQNTYTPPVAQGDAAGNLCLNYLGDTGIVGLGTTVGTASFQFTAAAQANFVIVVTTATGSTNSSVFSGTVAGFVSTTPGPGPCTFCSGKPNGTACDDGNACTQTDTCQNNVCVGSNPVVCTADQCHNAGTCNTGTGICSAATTKPDGTVCNDGSACTSGDVCTGGVCSGTTITCNDGNVCTDDSCNPATGCVYTNNTSPCDDGNACTDNDTCGGGVCHAGTTHVCNDNNPCTDDSCNPASGCVYTNNTSPCSDGNACTDNDTCSGGVCQPGTTHVCNDNNPCTDDSCNPASGCVYTNNTSPCSDGNACTNGDTCGGGTCHPGTPTICNDNNPCTDDACNPASGLCMYIANDNNTCTDGNVCTNDACSGGNCVFSPSGACGATGSVFYYRDNQSPGTEPTSKPVPSVGIDANNDAAADATTDGSGAYSIPNLSGHVTLAPLAKYGSPSVSDANGAISGLDASLIARTVVGAASMSPNQRLAGDVTGNGTLSGLDASEVARLSVGLVNHFDVAVATGSDWKFLRCDAYAYPGNPGCTAPQYDYSPISGGATNQNFYALLYGEVTGNWQPASMLDSSSLNPGTSLEEQAAIKADKAAADRFRQNPPTPVVRAAGAPPAELIVRGATTPLRAGERRQITIDLRNADGVLALDLTMRYDATRLAIVSVDPAGIGSGLNIAHGELNGTHKVSAYGVLPLSGSGSVMTVTVEALKPGQQAPLKIAVVANEGAIPVRVGALKSATKSEGGR